MASNFARRASVVVAGGVLYTASCAIAYTAIQRNKKDIEDTEKRLEDNNYSFVADPNRTDQFQNVADTYDDQIGRDEAVMGINLLRRSLLYFHATGTVLEVAAGTGRNIDYYPKSSVDRVLLTDTSDKMLLKARKKLRERSDESPQFACVEADSGNLDFPDQYFDTVVDTFGLCSYDDPVAVLKEMTRVCKPDGKILLLEHGRSKSWDFISKYLDKNAERHAKNWGCIWNRDLDEVIENSGLQVDYLQTWHFGTTYYIVCRPSTEKLETIPADSSRNVLASSSTCECNRT